VTVTEATFILIGHPVGHSLSPAIHHAAYAELGLPDHRYIAVDCPDRRAVEARIEELRSGELQGANVTVPWKRLALELADEVDASARNTGAANVLRPVSRDGRLCIEAHNTDVPALARELASFVPAPRAAVVIGNGGAALAAVAACRALGTDAVTVVARKFRGRPDEWEHAAELVRLGARVVAWPDDGAADTAWRRAVLSADVLVQTTSDGMSGGSDGTTVRGVVPWGELARSVFVYDVVYNPAETPFLRAARERGLRAENGLGMLVGQAALAIELWLGRLPPLAPLEEAALRALAAKSRA